MPKKTDEPIREQPPKAVLGTPNAKARAAVVKHCGGFAQADDFQIAAKWRTLDEATRAAYLAAVEKAAAPAPKETGGADK